MTHTTRKLLFLVNPVSGTKKKAPLKAAIEKACIARQAAFEIIDTRKDGDYSFLPKRIADEKISDIVVCGGDGSISTVAACLLDIDVAVGIIPTGSGNGLALAAGIPYSTERSLDIIFDGEATFIDGFMINDKFSCMMCGVGNDAQVAHDFAQTKVRGLRTYLRLSALHYFKSRAFLFSLLTKETNIRLDAFFITVSNSNQFGNHVTIAPRASLSDGLLDVVIVKKMHKLVLPFALLQQISGNNQLSELKNYRNNKNVFYFQATDITILNHSLAPIHIDGEPAGPAERLEIKILPKAFRLLQPSR